MNSLPADLHELCFLPRRIEPMTCGYHCDWWELSDRWCSCSDGDYKLISQQAPGQASPRNVWHQTQSLHTSQVVRSELRWCRCKISALPRTHSHKWLMVFHQSRCRLVMRPLLNRKWLWNLLRKQTVFSLLVWRWMIGLKLMPTVICASNQCKPLYDGSQPVYTEDIMKHVYIEETETLNASCELGMLHLSVRRHHDINTHIMILVWDGQKIESGLEWLTILVMHVRKWDAPFVKASMRLIVK